MAGLKLTRAQFAAFLKDHESIKQFEKLFAQTNENTDTIDISLAIEVGNALAAVVDTLSGVERLADRLDHEPGVDHGAEIASLAARLDHEPPRADDELRKAVDGILAQPPPEYLGPVLASGTYTPSLTNVANLDASTAYVCQYLRVGDTVTVSGRVDVDPTLAATSTALGISLPFTSSLANTEDLAGTGASPSVAGQVVAIFADTTNDRANLQFVSGDINNRSTFFSFTYRII